jgi:hypothetical protein
MFGQEGRDRLAVARDGNLSSFLVRVLMPHLVSKDIIAEAVVV